MGVYHPHPIQACLHAFRYYKVPQNAENKARNLEKVDHYDHYAHYPCW